MNSVHFCYWLQGLFELLPTDNLNNHQLNIIKKKLDYIFLNDPKPNNFCCFFKGYITFVNPTNISNEKIQIIKLQLRKEFINNIDKSYAPEKLDMLYKIHNEK